MNTLIGQTIVRAGRPVHILDIEDDAYICQEVGATTTFNTLRSHYDALFLVKKTPLRGGKNYKGKTIRHKQLKGVL